MKQNTDRIRKPTEKERKGGMNRKGLYKCPKEIFLKAKKKKTESDPETMD